MRRWRVASIRRRRAQFVDYAGTTMEVIDASLGEVKEAQLFVAVLGVSGPPLLPEATWTLDWLTHPGLRPL
jgi:transposase